VGEFRGNKYNVECIREFIKCGNKNTKLNALGKLKNVVIY